MSTTLADSRLTDRVVLLCLLLEEASVPTCEDNAGEANIARCHRPRICVCGMNTVFISAPVASATISLSSFACRIQSSDYLEALTRRE